MQYIKQFFTGFRALRIGAREYSICTFCFALLAFSIASLGAQELTQEPVQSTETSNIKAPKEFVVVPLLLTLPTIATLTARTIYNSMLAQAKDNIELRIVFGEKVSIAQVPSLFDKYLLEYNYDSVIFVAATSQTQQNEEIDSTLLEGVEELEGVKDLVMNFVVDIQMYHKGSTEAIYVDQYQSNLEGLKTSLLAKQSEQENDAEANTRIVIKEYKALLDTVETTAESVQYATIYINPEAETRPEYILKINKEPVLFSDYEKGVAYLALAKQQVFVYQILAGEEILVKKFKIKSDEESKSIEIAFLDTNRPRRVADDKMSIDVLGGYSYPLYSTQTSIFHPSVLVTNKIQYHSKWWNLEGYIGSTVQFTAWSTLQDTELTVDNRYGVHLTAGLDFDFAKNFVFYTGLAMGALLLTTTSVDSFNYMPEFVQPSLGIDMGLTYHILTLRHGSIRIIMELTGLSAYHIGTQEPVGIIDRGIAAQVNLGLGWRF